MSQTPDVGNAEAVSSTKAKRFAQRIVDEVDNFPYPYDNPMGYVDTMKDYYHFHVAGIDKPVGYIRHNIALRISQQQNYPYWQLNPVNKTFTVMANTEYARSLRVQRALETLGESAVADTGVPLQKKLYSATAVFSDNGELLFRIEHAATRVFGVPKYSVALIAWTSIGGERYYWVAKGASQTVGSQKVLKNFVSVPLSANEKPLACVIHAMLEQTDQSWWYTQVDTVGKLSYHTLRDTYSQPQVQYVYEAVTQEKDQDEIKSKGYNLMPLRAISDALNAGRFEPDAEVVFLDHFIRQGFVTIGDEPNLAKIQSWLHGRLE